MAQTGWDTLREALSDVDFPATKEQLVMHASGKGSDAGVLRLLRALPPETYQNMSEVRSSAPLDVAAEEGQTAEMKTQEARNPNHAVAEHLRSPAGPVDREL